MTLIQTMKIMSNQDYEFLYVHKYYNIIVFSMLKIYFFYTNIFKISLISAVVNVFYLINILLNIINA